MSEDTKLLIEIRDLLKVIAEPQLEKHHKKLRDAIRKVVGRKKAARTAVLLMDGSRNRASIAKQSGMDPSGVTRLIKSLEQASVCEAEAKHPRITITLPGNFFDVGEISDE